jgi:origin recognition complex subunit 5
MDMDADSDSEEPFQPIRRNLHAPQPCIRPLPSSRPQRPLSPHPKYHRLGKGKRSTTKPPRQPTSHLVPSDKKEAGITSLPQLSKFILIASFLASTNPPECDLRIFGRGLDEKKKRNRRVSGKPTKTTRGLTKVAQRLLGTTLFMLDRMLAILGALFEEDYRVHAHASGGGDGYGDITRSCVR